MAVRAAFPGHLVRTVSDLGWRGYKDPVLLALAEPIFDVFVTTDRRLEHQQNLKRFRLGIIVALVRSNKIEAYRQIFHALLQAAEAVKPGHVIRVPG